MYGSKKYPEKYWVLNGVMKCSKSSRHNWVFSKNISFWLGIRINQAAKENINGDEAIVHVDFSENYNKQQRAKQSADFGYKQFSILLLTTTKW